MNDDLLHQIDRKLDRLLMLLTQPPRIPPPPPVTPWHPSWPPNHTSVTYQTARGVPDDTAGR